VTEHARPVARRVDRQVTLPVVDDRAVVFVADEDDAHERVGTEEVRALLEEHHVATVLDGISGERRGDRVVRIRFDEKPVNGFERSFVAAAVLTDAPYHRREGIDDGALLLARHRRGVPIQEPFVHERRDGHVHRVAGNEVRLVVVVGEGLLRIDIVADPGRAVAAE
jgi:hypothetical protein